MSNFSENPRDAQEEKAILLLELKHERWLEELYESQIDFAGLEAYYEESYKKFLEDERNRTEPEPELDFDPDRYTAINSHRLDHIH